MPFPLGRACAVAPPGDPLRSGQSRRPGRRGPAGRWRPVRPGRSPRRGDRVGTSTPVAPAARRPDVGLDVADHRALEGRTPSSAAAENQAGHGLRQCSGLSGHAGRSATRRRAPVLVDPPVDRGDLSGGQQPTPDTGLVADHPEPDSGRPEPIQHLPSPVDDPHPLGIAVIRNVVHERPIPVEQHRGNRDGPRRDREAVPRKAGNRCRAAANGMTDWSSASGGTPRATTRRPDAGRAQADAEEVGGQ